MPKLTLQSKRWVRLTIRMTKPEYNLIAWAADRCGVSMQKFLLDAALAVAIDLRAALTLPRKLRKKRGGV